MKKLFFLTLSVCFVLFSCQDNEENSPNRSTEVQTRTVQACCEQVSYKITELGQIDGCCVTQVDVTNKSVCLGTISVYNSSGVAVFSIPFGSTRSYKFKNCNIEGENFNYTIGRSPTESCHTFQIDPICQTGCSCGSAWAYIIPIGNNNGCCTYDVKAYNPTGCTLKIFDEFGHTYEYLFSNGSPNCGVPFEICNPLVKKLYLGFTKDISKACRVYNVGPC